MLGVVHCGNIGPCPPPAAIMGTPLASPIQNVNPRTATAQNMQTPCRPESVPMTASGGSNHSADRYSRCVGCRYVMTKTSKLVAWNTSGSEGSIGVDGRTSVTVSRPPAERTSSARRRRRRRRGGLASVRVRPPQSTGKLSTEHRLTERSLPARAPACSARWHQSRRLSRNVVCGRILVSLREYIVNGAYSQGGIKNFCKPTLFFHSSSTRAPWIGLHLRRLKEIVTFCYHHY